MKAVSTGVQTVGDKGGTADPTPNPDPVLCYELVAEEPDDAGDGDCPKMVHIAWMNQPIDGLPRREDRRLVEGSRDGQRVPYRLRGGHARALLTESRSTPAIESAASRHTTPAHSPPPV